MAIILVLAALGFTGTKAFLQRARSARGISNLRQIGALALSYAADNNFQLPVQIDDWGNYSAPPTTRFFQNILRMNADLPTVGKDLYTSPWLPELFYDPTIKKGRQHPWGCFGVNDAIIVNAWTCNVKYGQRNGIPLSRINSPERKVIVCSAKSPGPSPWFQSSWYFSGDVWVDQGSTSTTPNGLPDPRHGGRTASLFADGHIELLDTNSMSKADRQKYFLLDP